mgnify:CR=1 FL=1
MKATQKAVRPVTKELRKLIPKVAKRTGQKEGRKHLKETITDKSYDWSTGAGAVSGAAYPAGAHFHLYDEGFKHYKSGAQVQGKGVLIKAVNAKRGESQKIFENEIENMVENA